MKGFKTILFGVLLALLSVFSSPDMQAWAAENVSWLGGSIGTIIVVLRALTNSSLFNIKNNQGM